MTELAAAYISIVPETSKIAPGVRRALGEAERGAEASGKNMGSKMASGLGTAMKLGAATAGTAVAATLGTALTKGFQRLTAIDDAKGKLSGLGHTAQSQAKIMDSALAAVKGTAFGLGDAATISASAVAAGIKPGQELTKYLSMTADAASIAGVGLGEMGAALNQVQTGQVAYTDNLNMLADRGIPIYQWLADEMKVTSGEVKKLAEKGKISSEVFFKAIQKNIGGAALESGKTVRGSFNNAIAALSRFGAAVQGPTFTRLPGFFTDVTKRIDDLTPAAERMAKAFDAKVFDEWGPAAKRTFDALRSSGVLDSAKETLSGLGAALKDAAPSAGQMAASLSKASGALGVSGWNLLLMALQAGTTTLNILNPLLSTTANLMQENQGAVTALMAAYLGFKTIPNLVGAVSPKLEALRSTTGGASSRFREFGDAYRTSLQYMRQGNPGISTASAHLNVLRANSFGAGQAMSGLRTAGGALMGAMGGPFGLALAGAGIALGAYAKHQADAAAKVAHHKQMVDALTDSVNYNTGALDAQGKAAITKELSKDREDLGGQSVFDLVEQNKQLGITLAQVQAAAEGQKPALDAVNAALDRQTQNSVQNTRAWSMYKDQFAAAGMSLADVTAALRGNEQQVERFNKVFGKGARMMRDEFENEMDAAGQAALKLGRALGDTNDQIGGAIRKARQSAEATGEVAKNLESIAQQFEGKGKGFSIELDTSQIRGAEEALKAANFQLEPLRNGKVRVTAETAEATAMLQVVASAAANVPAGKNIKVDAPGGQTILNTLRGMNIAVRTDNEKNIEVTAPLAPSVEQQLKRIGLEVRENNGKQIIVKADDSDYQRKKPDWLANARKNIEVFATVTGTGKSVIENPNFGRGLGVLKNADGGIRAYAEGGITALESYANGGHRLPDSALIQKPAPGPGLVQWAEPETGGEAFIPLALSKRGRSTEILAEVARRFGLALVDGNLNTIPSAAGSVVSAGVRSMFGRVNAFAEGGFLDPRPGEDNLKPPAVLARRLIMKYWPEITEIGGYRPVDPFPDHPSGRALDVMVGDRTSLGDTVKEWLHQNMSVLGLNYTIWKQMTQMAGGQPVGMGDRGSPTQNHWDHIHALFNPSDVDPSRVPTGLIPPPGHEADQYSPDQYSPDQGGYDGSGQWQGDYERSALTGDGDTVSKRLGSVVGAMVEGQLADILDVIGMNDSPGWMKGIAALEQQHRQKKTQDPRDSEAKISPEERQRITQQAESEKLTRKQEHDRELQRLEDEYRAKRLSKADYERRRLEATNRFDAEELRHKQELDQKLGRYGSYGGAEAKAAYEQAKLARKQRFDADKAALDLQKKNKQITREDHERRVNELRTKLENDDLRAKQEYERQRLSGKQDHDRNRPVKPKKPLRARMQDSGGVVETGYNLIVNKLGHRETTLPFDPQELKRSLEQQPAQAGGFHVNIGQLVANNPVEAANTVARKQRAAWMANKGQMVAR